MVTEWVLQTFAGLWLGLLGNLPQVDTEGGLYGAADGITNMWEAIWYAQNWLPIGMFVLAISSLLALRFALSAFALSHTIWKALPFT